MEEGTEYRQEDDNVDEEEHAEECGDYSEDEESDVEDIGYSPRTHTSWRLLSCDERSDGVTKYECQKVLNEISSSRKVCSRCVAVLISLLFILAFTGQFAAASIAKKQMQNVEEGNIVSRLQTSDRTGKPTAAGIL